MSELEHGNFTEMAKYYRYRPGYSRTLIRMLGSYIGATRPDFRFADIGAGTGILTRLVLDLGCSGYAIEPNDTMRQEGEKFCAASSHLKWISGAAESTGLPDSSVDWTLMGSSFHWTYPQQSLPEFHRILRKNGVATVVWNPRDLSRSPLLQEIENEIKNRVPEMRRISSGAKEHMNPCKIDLTVTGHFSDVVFIEAEHTEIMSVERYLGIWKSVNDIRVQAGEKRWAEILKFIESRIENLDNIEATYKTRSWTGFAT